MAKLTPKQERFVEEYLCDLNATQAAIRAGYSEKRASEIGYQLLQKTTVSNAIETAIKKREERTDITQDMVVAQLAKIAFLDIRDIVTWDKDGIKVRPSEEVDGTVLTEVSETMSEGGWTKKVKMSDRMRALDMLGRHLGMFPNKVEVSGQVTQVNEQKTHIIHELVADPDIAERVKHSFRRGIVSSASQD